MNTGIDLSVKLGDVDGDGKQDVTVYQNGGKIARFTIYDAKKAVIDIVEMVVSVLVSWGLITCTA